MAAPEARLWTNLRKSLPKQVAAGRIENRAGPGMPDVAAVFPASTAWVELKAPKTRPKLQEEETDLRPYLFGFDQKFWDEACKQGDLLEKLTDQTPTDKFPLNFATPNYVRSTQAAWHARVFAVGGVSFFLEKPHGPSTYRIFSPYVDRGSGSLRLGLVCDVRDAGFVWYVLRACTEMHSLAALRA